MELSPDELAQIGYTAYGDWVDWTNYAGGTMPSWAELPEPSRQAWAAAAGAIVRKVLTPNSRDGVADV